MTQATSPCAHSILVLGAGELGLPVVRNLARVAQRSPGSKISVLLRDSTINTQLPEKKRTSKSYVDWESNSSLRTW